MPKSPPKERHLRDSVAFVGHDPRPIDLRAPYPTPEKGDVLLRPPVGSETFVFGLEQWVPSDMERLGYLANQYRDQARELVALWLQSHVNPETVVNAVGFLYRHAIELRLKALMVYDPAFRKRSDKKNAARMKEHGLSVIWDRVKPAFKDVYGKDEEAIVSCHLRAIDKVDPNGEGFRYPFQFKAKGKGAAATVVREPLMGDLTHMSFENFVWVLDGIYNWLTTLVDALEELREHEREMMRDFQS